MNLDSYFTEHISNATWIVHRNAKGKASKLLEENKGGYLPDLYRHFLART
jgi:hypothetical protein